MLRQSPKNFFYGGAILLGCLLLGLALPPAYHAAKLWRAHRLVEEAQGASAQAPIEAKLLAAYSLAPHDPEVLRALARFQLAAGERTAGALYQQLLARPEATRQDQREAAEAFLTLGDLRQADRFAQNLVATGAKAEDFALLARLATAAQQGTTALARIGQARALDPDNRAYRLSEAELQLLSPAPPAQALATLRDLANGRDVTSLQALELLAGSAKTNPKWLSVILDQMQRHPSPNDASRFAVWDLERRLHRRDATTLQAEAIATFQSAGPARRAAAARWLYGQGADDAALQLAPWPDALNNQELFAARLDALAREGKWNEVQFELEDTRAPLPPILLSIYQARAATEMGDAPRGAGEWESARNEAAAEASQMLYVGQYATQVGALAEAEKTYRRMTTRPAQALPGYLALLELETRQNDDPATLETLAAMRQAFPLSPEVQNDWAYLSLLLDQNQAEARALAQSLVAAQPTLLAYRSTLALAEVRGGDAAAARRVYAGLTIDWTKVAASWKMVYAIVLSADGDRMKASTLAQEIDRTQLRPAEAAFFERTLPAPQPAADASASINSP